MSRRRLLMQCIQNTENIIYEASIYSKNLGSIVSTLSSSFAKSDIISGKKYRVQFNYIITCNTSAEGNMAQIRAKAWAKYNQYISSDNMQPGDQTTGSIDVLNVSFSTGRIDLIEIRAFYGNFDFEITDIKITEEV